MSERHRSMLLRQEPFAEPHVRLGLSSRSVVRSRWSQILLAVGLGLLALWLGLASYAAIVKHLQTIAEGRELVGLQGDIDGLQTTVAQLRSAAAAAERRAQRTPELLAELSYVRAARERAGALARAAADEARELSRELALAEDRIRELKCDLARAEAPRRAAADRVAPLGDGARRPVAAGGEITLAGEVMLAEPGCLPP
jgi:hypothetical protein